MVIVFGNLGMNLLKRHRTINNILKEELKNSIHAITMTLKTPQEIGEKKEDDNEKQQRHQIHDMEEEDDEKEEGGEEEEEGKDGRLSS